MSNPSHLCSNCHEPLEPGSVFCTHCGTRALKLRPRNNVAPTKRKRTIRKIGFGLGLLAALAIAIWAIRAPGQSPTYSGASTPSSSASASPSASKSTSPSSSSTASSPSSSSTASSAAVTPSASNGGSQGWVHQSIAYQSSTISLEVPTSISHLSAASSSRWVWTTSSGSSSNGITVEIVPNKTSGANQSLGPNTYGTPIVQTPSTASQTIDIHWSGQWLAVKMVVPASHIDWLGKIARSVGIT